MTHAATRGRTGVLPVVRVVVEETPFLAHAPPPACLAAALLDAQRRVRAVALLSGAWWGCCVRPSEVYRPALVAGAAGLYLSHRHPAEELWALPADCQSTERLWDMGKALGMHVHDHLIFDKGGRCASLPASKAAWCGHHCRGRTERCPLPVACVVLTRDGTPRRAPATRSGRTSSTRPVVTLHGLRARVLRDERGVDVAGDRRVSWR